MDDPNHEKESDALARFLAWATGQAAYWGFILGFVWLGLSAFKWIAVRLFPPKECTQKKLVAKIGGCDAFGNCGVTFSDGSHGTANKPSPNQEICVK